MRRRTALVGVLALFSGCNFDLGQNRVDPSQHVTDWQKEPAQGLADPVSIERNSSENEDCTDIALDFLESRIDTQVDDLTGVSHGFSTGGETVTREHLRVVRTIHSTDGEVTSKPTVSFSALRKTVPETIHVVRQERKTSHQCRWPVYVRDEIAYKS